MMKNLVEHYGLLMKLGDLPFDQKRLVFWSHWLEHAVHPHLHRRDRPYPRYGNQFLADWYG
jgi:hypothetical protein